MRKLVLRPEVVQPPTLDRIILPGNVTLFLFETATAFARAHKLNFAK